MGKGNQSLPAAVASPPPCEIRDVRIPHEFTASLHETCETCGLSQYLHFKAEQWTLAERGRCAKIAEDFHAEDSGAFGPDYYCACGMILDKIRSGE